MRPIISIITPTFNRVSLLKGNLESVLSQDRQDIQHVIVDNLSTDNTTEIVLQYKDATPFEVVYIREKDRGIYHAMNKGIRASSGQWLIFLGSDDRFAASDVLHRFFGLLPCYPNHDLIVGGILYGANPTSATYRPSYYDTKLRYHAFQHQGTFINIRMFKKYGLYDERYKIAADGVFNAKYYCFAKYVILDFPVAIQLSGGASSELTLRNYLEYTVTALFYRKFPLWKKWEYIIALVREIRREVRESVLRSKIVRRLRGKL